MAEADRPIVVLGSHGQVGRALIAQLGTRAVGFDRTVADLGEPDELPALLASCRPGAVINAAAYTQVDRAETESELAMTINGEAPGVIGRWCAEHRVPFVHFSTDYVFDGIGDEPRRESDTVGPLSVYGATKLAGERRVAEAGGDWLVLRTSWLFDATGRNFVTTMLGLMRERSTLSVVDDQHGAPTYARHLAAATIAALEAARKAPEFPRGLYHVCAGGETTWHGFAIAIAEEARAHGIDLAIESITPITSEQFPAAARRPKNSRLNTDKAYEILGVRLPQWRRGLIECIESL